MQFQSAAHEQSYRRACKAVAHARREDYTEARGMATSDLLDSVVSWTLAGNALDEGSRVQLRMMGNLARRRTAQSRTR
jgi:hypothetical protein